MPKVDDLPELPIVLLLAVCAAVVLLAVTLLFVPPKKKKEKPKLIQCEDCGHAVSRKAVMCPGCGRDT